MTSPARFPNVQRERARQSATFDLLPKCSNGDCPNMKCTYEGMDGERYRCAVCGESYYLDYEDMK